MKVEIWSDVMCPFCYIGKRKFEQALNDFGHKDEVEVEWKSFQLDPGLETDPKKNVNQMLAEKKGWTIDYARQMNANVTNLAKEVGLSYNFDTAVVANSFDAHRLVHLAKKSHLDDAAEERLFKAYFTEGKNIADHDTLIQLGTDIGLEREEVKQLLESGSCADEVEMDKYEARKAGVRGVPFFLLDNKFAVSGAQSPQTFLNALQTAWAETEK
jgi:predicted DsbA family dithiol-disulfide isomerase